MTKKVAVIQFPGSNCEYETLTSIQSAGAQADVISWTTSMNDLSGYGAFVLPGGFSFQDRVRAGVVSSKIPILKDLARLANDGVPILGICNGCQILAEAGLVPNYLDQDHIQMALAPNMKGDQFHGFMCDWVYVRITNPGSSIFTRYYQDSDVLPIQINHGEGNVKLRDASLLQRSSCTQITYCTEEGAVDAVYPCNPNGSDFNLAGLSNESGNVLALMPHPERGAFVYQMPRYMNNVYSQYKRDTLFNEKGPWFKLFLAISDYLKDGHL